jgi:DNA (cytosine-5)-methyltransferase 1
MKSQSTDKRKRRRFISFFSGALGLDLGLEKTGLECLAVNDSDRTVCDTIRLNFARRSSERRARIYDRDIRSLSASSICDDLAISPGELFAVVGGPPCQAFSTAGRRLGLNDDRGNVFLHFVRLIGELQPRYAVFENVRGLLSAPLTHRPHSQRGEGHPPLQWSERPKGALRHILAALKEFGYQTTFTLYNTANFGVPQIRERLIFFASRDGENIPFMSPTHSQNGEQPFKKWRTLRDVIWKLQSSPGECGSFPEKRLKYFRMLAESQNWRDLPAHVQRKAMGQSFYSGGGKTGFYRRLAWDKPSPTLVTSPTMPATDLCHPSQLRPLSVQEYAALQTFPRDFAFAGRIQDKYKQIGNAVPCLFGEAIARHVIAFDEGELASTEESHKLSRYVGTDHISWSAEGSQQDLPL